MIIIETILKILPIRIRKEISKVSWLNKVEEIRFRIGQVIIFYVDNKEIYLNGSSICTNEDLKEIITYISKSSLYAYEDEIRNGFITIEGGHRIGLAGKVIKENKGIKTIRNISSLNIRVCKQVIGCSKLLMPYIIENNQFNNTLILSPPKCGKTTILRDVIRNCSDGWKQVNGYTVGLVDERSEVASCYKGIPQNDVGRRTDVLDCCNKIDGMLMLIRAMAPDIIGLDEIGKKEEIEYIHYAIHSGCYMICTMHCRDVEELQEKTVFMGMLENKIFKRYIFLDNKGGIGGRARIYNEKLEMYL